MPLLDGIELDPSRVDPDRVASLRGDAMLRHLPPVRVTLARPFTAEDAWVPLDATYPDQVRQRFELIRRHGAAVIDRLPGEGVEEAERELLDRTVEHLLTAAPKDFVREGDRLACRLTGVTVDLRPGAADPLAAVAVLCSGDRVLLLPSRRFASTQYELRSGALMFTEEWSLRSRFDEPEPPAADIAAHAAWVQQKQRSRTCARLGQTVTEIHDPFVPYYVNHFLKPVEKFFRSIKPDQFYTRQNWWPTVDTALCQHADLAPEPDFEPTAEALEERGVLRSERQSLVKLPRSGAIVFGIKVFAWPLAEVRRQPEVLAALRAAREAMPPKMIEFRRGRVEGLDAWFERYAA